MSLDLMDFVKLDQVHSSTVSFLLSVYIVVLRSGELLFKSSLIQHNNYFLKLLIYKLVKP